MLPKSKAVREFGLVFVSSQKMRQLNKRYRGRNHPTNVLSFETGPSNELGAGDVVLCPSVIKAEAKKYGFTQKNWMTRLVVHGILHLAGYGHDTRKDTEVMENTETRILNKLGVILGR
ncbi:MAG: rRNA maturation RNase YbeY [Parcubacteria group bacterium]|nr:rRNA maturation RNase YbeY [Parcubacteria group bacterium]